MVSVGGCFTASVCIQEKRWRGQESSGNIAQAVLAYIKRPQFDSAIGVWKLESQHKMFSTAATTQVSSEDSTFDVIERHCGIFNPTSDLLFAVTFEYCRGCFWFNSYLSMRICLAVDCYYSIPKMRGGLLRLLVSHAASQSHAEDEI